MGREALVNPGADRTADLAINRTQRYFFYKANQLTYLKLLFGVSNIFPLNKALPDLCMVIVVA